MEHFLEFGLSIVTACSTGIIGYLMYRLKKHEEKKETEYALLQKETLEAEHRRQIEYNAICSALLALIHDRILSGYKYYKRNGGISAQN